RAHQRALSGAVAKTTDVVNVGDGVKVKVIGFDERGKVKPSMRVADQQTGEDITDKVGPKGGRRREEKAEGDAPRRQRIARRHPGAGRGLVSPPGPLTYTDCDGWMNYAGREVP
ncbi:MAG: hypothetical protein M5U08_13915, partial [Burkholderiales bacterium]|nr:hypothetical protein [Burkholderiales bacterium]